jgi:acyl-ACP thioesterase
MLSRRASFPIHTYEVDAFGTLEVAALSGYLQEVAALHAAELGVGLDALRGKGLTWVLSRQRIELAEPVRLGDVVEIETWPAGIDRLFALRDFVVRRGAVEVARATTHWLVLDLATRRPVRPAEVLDPRFPRERRAPVVAMAERRLPAVAEGWREKRFHVRYADIDVNLHVTNTSYVTWAVEAVPVEVWRACRPVTLEVQYLAEGHHGGAVLSRVAEAGTLAFGHAIAREEDGKELARLSTRWAPREPGAAEG